MLRALAVVVLLPFAGCVEALLPARDAGTPSAWSWEVEPSMAPDFTGDGDTYPILLVHQHHLASKRQQEKMANVVCATTDGDRIELLKPSADVAMTPCLAPPADAATGRLYLERADFDAAAPRAVVALQQACAGGLVLLDADRQAFDLQTPGHTFRIEQHANETFSVDGRWIQPGTALKIAYTLNAGDEKDQEHVRVVFDQPGRWLTSRVAPWDPDLDGDVPPRPLEGTGLHVDIPLDAATPRDPFEATLRATPGTLLGVEAIRLVHDGARLTEATLRYATREGSVTWYGAGRTGHSLRLLGAESPTQSEDGADPEALLSMLDAPWNQFRAGTPGTLTDLRLDPTTAWTSPAGHALAVDVDVMGCADGCVLVKSGGVLTGSEWQRLLAPEPYGTRGALTLHVLAFDDGRGEGPTNLWWHDAGA